MNCPDCGKPVVEFHPGSANYHCNSAHHKFQYLDSKYGKQYRQKIAKLDFILFTEYAPNKCWKKATTGSDPNSTLWVSLPTCTEIPKVVVINKSERIELFFQKFSTITIKDN